MRGIVVVPTYNEKDNVSNLIDAVLKVPINVDILIVDDNSPDGTSDIVAAYSERNDRVHLLKRMTNRGFGPSYVDGFKWALSQGYEAVFSMDCDFSHAPDSLPDLMLALKTHDMSLGSRYCHGKVSVVNWPISRLFLSMFAGKYVRAITGLHAADPTTGFRGFTPRVLEAIDLDSMKSNGYSFLVEILYRAQRCGARIAEVPIIFTERREGQSKMSRKIMMEAAMMPWRLRFSGFRPRKIVSS